ncbi:hypothetical protein SYNTR_0326 [Candidatus Syntrophocurvum alkaliphilum]|uniref:Uncharacterized protein n=1 Tax=Candidatus Syntrophocurvum alkaliphilum TaxID=2293317 RepID=A0A6I6DH14_9FIRM|nr:hypothetical protein [Candidatus Syntrophocurvum alkaliphilum]QGT98919.1 hypothetical protein SYNTR_0326 [Candidatus Syntrophocurvum alkaliphilum]
MDKPIKKEWIKIPIIKKAVIPLGRPLYLSKENNITQQDLIIEASGNYRLIDKPNHIIIKNDDCCRSIQVTVKTKDD